MCLAVPARITALSEGDQATVVLGGVSMSISLALLDDARVGDYVIVHTGFALAKLDPAEAAQTLALMREAGPAAETPPAANPAANPEVHPPGAPAA